MHDLHHRVVADMKPSSASVGLNTRTLAVCGSRAASSRRQCALAIANSVAGPRACSSSGSVLSKRG